MNKGVVAVLAALIYVALPVSAQQVQGGVVAVSPGSSHLLTRQARSGILVGDVSTEPLQAPVYSNPDLLTNWWSLGAIAEDLLLVRYGTDGIGWLHLNGGTPSFTLAGSVPRLRKVRAVASLIVAVDSIEIVALRAGGARELLYRLVPGDSLVDFAIAANGSRVALSVRSRAGNRIELRTPGETGAVTLATAGPATSLALSPDGSRLIALVSTPLSRWFYWEAGAAALAPFEVQDLELRLSPRELLDLIVVRRMPTPEEIQALVTGRPSPLLTLTPPELDQTPVRWDLGEAEFSPDGRLLSLSNFDRGIAILNVPANGPPQYSRAILIPDWASADQRGHRWNGDRILAFSYHRRNREGITPWAVNPITRVVQRIALQPEYARLINARPELWPSGLVLNGSGAVRAYLSVWTSTFRTYRSRDLSLAAGPLRILESPNVDFSLGRYHVFDDGTHIVVQDGAGPRVHDSAGGSPITPDFPNAEFGWLGAPWWAFYTAGAARTDSLAFAVYEGITGRSRGAFASLGAGEHRLRLGHQTVIVARNTSEGEKVVRAFDTAARPYYDGNIGPPRSKFVLAFAPGAGGWGSLLFDVPYAPNPLRSLLYQGLPDPPPATGVRALIAHTLASAPVVAASRNGDRVVALVSEQQAGAAPRFRLRMWTLDANLRATEVSSTELTRYDAAQLVTTFGVEGRALWAATGDLRLVAIPVGSRIHVVDVERNQLILTTTLGMPVALTREYLVLSSGTGQSELWPIPQRSP